MEQRSSYHIPLRDGGLAGEVVVLRVGRGWRVYWVDRQNLACLTIHGTIGRRLTGWTTSEVQAIEALLHAQTERPWLVPVQP